MHEDVGEFIRTQVGYLTPMGGLDLLYLYLFPCSY